MTEIRLKCDRDKLNVLLEALEVFIQDTTNQKVRKSDVNRAQELKAQIGYCILFGGLKKDD